jgi:hypothetical protein
MPCNFCVSSCFLWLAKLELRVACFPATKRHKKTPKSTKNVPDDSGQNVELDYLKLLYWTDRHFRTDKRGVIPATCGAILDRLDCSEETWFEPVQDFRRRFRSEAGSVPLVRAFRSKRRERRAQAASV